MNEPEQAQGPHITVEHYQKEALIFFSDQTALPAMKHSTAIAVVVAASLASETSAARITMASFLPASKLSIATTAIVTTTLLLKASAGEIDGWNLGNVLVTKLELRTRVWFMTLFLQHQEESPMEVLSGLRVMSWNLA
jgi:hypothetical protein